MDAVPELEEGRSDRTRWAAALGVGASPSCPESNRSMCLVTSGFSALDVCTYAVQGGGMRRDERVAVMAMSEGVPACMYSMPSAVVRIGVQPPSVIQETKKRTLPEM